MAKQKLNSQQFELPGISTLLLLSPLIIPLSLAPLNNAFAKSRVTYQDGGVTVSHEDLTPSEADRIAKEAAEKQRQSIQQSGQQQSIASSTNKLTTDQEKEFNEQVARIKGAEEDARTSSEVEDTRATKNSTSASQDKNCKVSAGIASKYGCSTTETIIMTGQVSNIAGQALGSQATQGAGIAATINAQQSGTQQAAYEAAAETQRVAAGQQMAVGTMNAAMGIYEIMKAREHDANAAKMKDSADRANNIVNVIRSDGELNTEGKRKDHAGYAEAASGTVAAEIIGAGVTHDGSKIGPDLNNKFTIKTKLDDQMAAAAHGMTTNPAEYQKAMQLAMQRRAEMGEKENAIRQEVKTTALRAADEQEGMSSKAMAQGITSAMQGFTQAGSGTLGMMAASQLDGIADKVSNAPTGGFTLDTGTVSPGTDQFGGGSTAINPGTSTDAAVAVDNSQVPGGDLSDLSPPISPDAGGDSGPGTGPIAGKFAPGLGNANGSSGAGGGGIGLGATSAAKNEDPEQGPRAADNRSNTAYGGGNLGGYVSGAVGAEKSPDLSFLANMLPKPGEKEATPTNILNFGNRSPAGMQPYSFLDRKANLFQRISERTTMKIKEGNVGS